MEIDRYELEASICRESFYEFVVRMWDSVVPEKLVLNWHIKYLSDELQIIAERVFRNHPKEYDLIVNIPPGSTKSTICSIMFPPWIWTRMLTARMICASYAHELGMDLSRKCRNLVRSDKYRALFPEVELSPDQNTKTHFATIQEGSRVITSTGGAITGKHAHFIIVDDPINPKEAASETEIKTANSWIDETLSTRKVDKEIVPTILIMQRLHQNDVTGHMLEKVKGKPEFEKRIKHICLPATITKDVRPRILRREYKDGMLDPIRISQSVCGEYRNTLGEYGYAAQFLQTPIPPGGSMFKTSKIRIEVPPTKMVARVRYWDKAGTHNAGAYTSGVLLAKDTVGRFWIMDAIRGRWDAYEREQIILQTAHIDGGKVLIGLEQEPGSGGKESAQNTVRRLAGFRVKVDLPKGDKVLRAEPFAIQVNAENVFMAAGAWNKDYIEELQYFPNSKYKDQVDASSGSFAVLTGNRLRIGGLK